MGRLEWITEGDVNVGVVNVGGDGRDAPTRLGGGVNDCLSELIEGEELGLATLLMTGEAGRLSQEGPCIIGLEACPLIVGDDNDDDDDNDEGPEGDEDDSKGESGSFFTLFEVWLLILFFVSS